MYTPSLGRRVVVSGVAVVTMLSLCLDALLFLSLRSGLNAALDRDLARDSRVVRAEALRLEGPALAERLADLGVRVVLRDASGGAVAAPAPAGQADGPLATRRVELPDGVTAEVAVSRAGSDRSLHRLLILESFVTPLVIALALLMLRLVAEVALRPLDRIAAAARRTAEGQKGERLRPSPADTRLGQMASAYDTMLDALEASVGEAQAAQAESETLLAHNRRILDTAREAYVAVNDSGIIVDWNTEAERIFGRPRAEALGRPVAGTVMPADERSAGDNGLDRFRATDATDRVVEIVALHRDGHRFPARMTVWSTSHGGHETVSAFIWDVTEQRRAQEAVARLAAVVESADEAMLSSAPDGSLLTWNAAAERMYGHSAAEAIGRHVHLIIPGDLREGVGESLDAVLRRGEVERMTTLGLRKSGSLTEVALTISPVRDASGSVCAASWVARDITEERWIASQLDASLRALELALEDAKASEADTRRFLDDAAHQLRAPITSIRACAEGLLRTNDVSASDELLSAVVRETSRAGKLMSGLLRLARLNHGRRSVPVPCDLVRLCSEEGDRIQVLSPHVKVVVSQWGALDVDHPSLDPDAVGEIVANLLDNACRHAASRVELLLSRDRDWVEIEVRDDGPGLPDATVDSAFERFVSLDGKGGSGLGLPIARELARAEGGDLVYQGKAFLVRLPTPGHDIAAAPTAGAPLDRSHRP